MSLDFIKGDDKRTKFYTGLTTFFLFTTIFDLLQKMPGMFNLMDEFLMVLMKLGLNRLKLMKI